MSKLSLEFSQLHLKVCSSRLLFLHESIASPEWHRMAVQPPHPHFCRRVFNLLSYFSAQIILFACMMRQCWIWIKTFKMSCFQCKLKYAISKYNDHQKKAWALWSRELILTHWHRTPFFHRGNQSCSSWRKRGGEIKREASGSDGTQLSA